MIDPDFCYLFLKDVATATNFMAN